MLFALVAKKVEYDTLDLESYMLKSPTNKEKRVGNSSPSIGNLMIFVISKSVGLIVVKGMMKPFMEIIKNLK